MEETKRTAYDILRDDMFTVKTIVQDNNYELKSFNLKLDQICTQVARLEKVVFRSNGNPGIIDRLEDIEEAERKLTIQRTAEDQSRRQLRYYIIGAVVMSLFNVLLNTLMLIFNK